MGEGGGWSESGGGRVPEQGRYIRRGLRTVLDGPDEGRHSPHTNKKVTLGERSDEHFDLEVNMTNCARYYHHFKFAEQLFYVLDAAMLGFLITLHVRYHACRFC